MENNKKLKSMSGLVLINQETKELLFQKRPKETKWNPNVWGFFGGKNENNETKEQCLIREMKEEINLDLNINELNLLKIDIYENTECYFFYHIIKPAQINKLKLLEGQDWTWKSFKDSLNLDFGTVSEWNLNFLNNEVKDLLSKPKKGASAIIINYEKILLTLRSPTCSSYPNYWTMPGGRIELGETSTKNVIRKVKEEVNLEFIPTKLYTTFQWNNLELSRYLGTWSGNIKLQESEVTQYKFYTYKETQELELAFDYKDIINKLFEDKLIK